MSWSGAQLHKSADAGATYEAVLSSTAAATIGSAATLLADFAGGNVFDHLSSVSVVLRSGGPLLSYSTLQVLNGAGTCVLGIAGRWEVLQYTTATLTAANTYTLTGLLRGRRGSEWAQGLHAVGDTFVLADAQSWKRPNPGTAQIGLARLYRGVTFRAALGSATAQAFTNSAVGLECYAPVRLTGTRDGSNNLTINWIRRTRLDGAWRDFVDAGIGETSLRFDVEIWNSGYTTLLRTFSSLAASTTPYSAAEQTTDGTTPGDPVYVRVYQISPTVGRGYKLEGVA